MEAANDNPNIAAKFSSKKVNIRLDFWALFTDVDDNIQYKKLDNITITRDGYAVAPLYGMPAVAYSNHPFKKAGQDTVTTLPLYVLLKTATGDINHDGYENEIAVLVCDTEGVKLCIYQISYSASSQQFSIKQMTDAGTIYKYNLTGYYKLLGYNGFSRAPGADILTGDFNGDGQTEIAAVYQGASPRHLYADIYKWNNNSGKFDVTQSLNNDYGTKYSTTPLSEWGHDYGSKGPVYKKKDTAGEERRLLAPLAGIKAAVLDINSDGTDDIVFGGFRYNFLEHLQQKVWFDSDGWVGTFDQHADYSVHQYLALITFDKTDRKLKPAEDYVWEGDTILTRHIPHGIFKIGDWHDSDEYLYSFGGKNSTYFPVVDREIALAAEPFFGTLGVLKPLDDVVLRYYGAHMYLFMSNGSTLTAAH